MKRIAIILTRRDSSRVKNKNSKVFYQNKSLLEITINKIKNSNQFDLIINSTNCPECQAISSKMDIIIHKRTEENSLSSSSSIDALNEVIYDLKLSNNSIYLFQCNSPFIKTKTISNFVQFSITQDPSKTITSGHISKDDIWTLNSERIFINAPRRQQEREGFYVENSAIYKIPVESGNVKIDFNKFSFFEIPSLEGFDINTNQDWRIALSLLSINEAIIE